MTYCIKKNHSSFRRKLILFFFFSLIAPSVIDISKTLN